MLRRTDGQLADFSYRKCINRLLWGGWDNRLPRLLELRALAVQSRPSPEVGRFTLAGGREWVQDLGSGISAIKVIST